MEQDRDADSDKHIGCRALIGLVVAGLAALLLVQGVHPRLAMETPGRPR